VGLIPEGLGDMELQLRQALAERRGLLEERAAAALGEALSAGEMWTRSLGSCPQGPAAVAWRRHACTIAAYRDRYGIVGATALGPAPPSTAQRLDASRARAALATVQWLAFESPGDAATRRTAAAGLPPFIHGL
jgi:hypothetical protein